MLLYGIVKNKKFIALLAMLTIFSNNNVYAYVKANGPADAGKSIGELNGYTDKEWDRLMDNDLEYSELGDLIHNFNPYISEAYSQFRLNSDKLSLNIDELNNAKRDFQDLYDSAKEIDDKINLKFYKAQIEGLNKLISSTNKSKNRLDKDISIANSTIRQEEQKLILLSKQLMIQFDSTRRNRELLEASLKLSEKNLEIKSKMKDLGLAEKNAYDKAYSDYIKSFKELNSLKEVEEGLRKNLISMCGWDINALPNIHEISDIDLDKISQIDLQSDTNKAIGNNYELIAFRHSDYKKSPAKLESRNLNEEQLTAKVKADILLLYNGLLSAATEYKKADLIYKKALIEKDAYEINYKTGASSDIVYMAKAIETDNLFKDFDIARIELLSAYEKYTAAVNGYIEQ